MRLLRRKAPSVLSGRASSQVHNLGWIAPCTQSILVLGSFLAQQLGDRCHPSGPEPRGRAAGGRLSRWGSASPVDSRTFAIACITFMPPLGHPRFLGGNEKAKVRAQRDMASLSSQQAPSSRRPAMRRPPIHVALSPTCCRCRSPTCALAGWPPETWQRDMRDWRQRHATHHHFPLTCRDRQGGSGSLIGYLALFCSAAAMLKWF